MTSAKTGEHSVVGQLESISKTVRYGQYLVLFALTIFFITYVATEISVSSDVNNFIGLMKQKEMEIRTGNYNITFACFAKKQIEN